MESYQIRLICQHSLLAVHSPFLRQCCILLSNWEKNHQQQIRRDHINLSPSEPFSTPSHPHTYTERFNTMSSVKLGRFRSQLKAFFVFSHTEELWINEIVCLWMTIYTLPSRGLSTLAKELKAATRVMQSSFNEVSTLVSDSTNVNKRNF